MQLVQSAAMVSEMHATAHEAFVRIAHQADDDHEPRLCAPGVEGVQIFFEGNVSSVSVADVRRWYESNGWSAEQSLTWSNVETLLACFEKERQETDCKISREGKVSSHRGRDPLSEGTEYHDSRRTGKRGGT